MQNTSKTPARSLILIKHARPAIDPSLPAREWGLGAEGIASCSSLAERLRRYRPQQFISSIEPKAIHTAQIAAQTLGVSWQMAGGLHEQERSRERYTSNDVFEQQIQKLFNQPDQVVYGSESAQQAQARFSQAIQALLAEAPEQGALAVVAHGTVISLFVAQQCHVEPFSLWKRLGLPSFVVLTLPELTLYEIVEKL